MKTRSRWLLAILIVVSLFGIPSNSFGSIQIESERELDYPKIFQAIASVEWMLAEMIPPYFQRELYLGGASVTAILNNLYEDTPLMIRDLDFYLVTRAPYNTSDWESFFKAKKIKKFRVLSDMIQFKIGGIPTSVALLTDHREFNRVGVFNVDTMKIHTGNFIRIFQTNKSAILAHISEWLYGKEVHREWLDRQIFINKKNLRGLSWEILAFRAVRTFAKFGFQRVSTEVLQTVAEMREENSGAGVDVKAWLKGMLKVLGDSNPGLQLKMLVEMKALSLLSSVFQEEILRKPVDELNDLILRWRKSSHVVSALIGLVVTLGTPEDHYILKNMAQFLDNSYQNEIQDQLYARRTKIQCSSVFEENLSFLF